MKNLLFKSLMIIGFTTVLVACEKDDSSSTAQSTNAALIGTWEATTARNINKESGVIVEDSTTTLPAWLYTTTFYANGTVINSFLGDQDTAKYTLAGNILTLIYEYPNNPSDTSVLTLTINSNTMKSVSEDTYTYDSVAYYYYEEISWIKK